MGLGLHEPLDFLATFEERFQRVFSLPTLAIQHLSLVVVCGKWLFVVGRCLTLVLLSLVIVCRCLSLEVAQVPRWPNFPVF